MTLTSVLENSNSTHASESNKISEEMQERTESLSSAPEEHLSV